MAGPTRLYIWYVSRTKVVAQTDDLDCTKQHMARSPPYTLLLSLVAAPALHSVGLCMRSSQPEEMQRFDLISTFDLPVIHANGLLSGQNVPSVWLTLVGYCVI